LTVSFKDKDGVAQTPSTIKYQVDYKAGNVNILPETSFTPPAETIEITITNDLNLIVDETNDLENHEVTVTATYAGGEVMTEEFVYIVKNLFAK